MIIFVQKLHLGFSILGGAATLALLNELKLKLQIKVFIIL
jgi:hypothetical protein